MFVRRMMRLFLGTLAFAAGCASAGAGVNDASCFPVSRVVDGDTFQIDAGGGRKETVRLIGVDTPETVKPGSPVEPYGTEASDFAKKLLTGQTVCLERDVEERDRYGRLLAYAYLKDGTFVNELLLAEGYAQVLTVPPNVKYADHFQKVQREAREAKRGLWGEGETQPTAAAEAVPDRDCKDFASQEEAQAFFEAQGGPERDPHRLDGDKDGIACESYNYSG